MIITSISCIVQRGGEMGVRSCKQNDLDYEKLAKSCTRIEAALKRQTDVIQEESLDPEQKGTGPGAIQYRWSRCKGKSRI